MSASGENEEELVVVARAVRTRGLKGEIVADLLTDFPDRFTGLDRLLAVGPNGDYQPLKLESFWFQNDRIVLKFRGYDSVEAAKNLVGYEFGLPESERVELAEGEFYDWELEGCLVKSKTGQSVGRVREVMRTGGVELLVIESEGRDEILVPMAESIVREIDVSGKRILIDPPEGLLDL